MIESINHTLETSNWYHIAPGIECLQMFANGLPKQLKATVTKLPALTREPSLSKLLFTSRLKGKLFSISSEEMVDSLLKDDSYSIVQESRFLMTCFSNNSIIEAWSFLDNGDKLIHMKSGSKVFVHRDNDGKVLAMIVAPSNDTAAMIKSAPTEIVSAINSTTSKDDIHSINTSCTMRLD